MGLFDKIKDNARDLSMKALEATREYDEDYQQNQQNNQATTEPVDTDERADTATSQQPAEEAAVDAPASEISDEINFLDEPSEPAQITKEPEEEKPTDKTEKPTTRKSKVTEVTKEEHEKAEKEKQQEKAKKAAKERLAKSYIPSYKKADSGSKVEVSKAKEEKPASKKPASTTKSKSVGIIDVAPGKYQDPAKRALYARERAALSALASQRKLNGTVPLYVANHMNFRTRVFINRVEYSGSFGKNILPIEDIAWVKLRYGGTGVIIETKEGKRVVMVVKQSDRLAFADAILKVQAMQPKKGKPRDTQTVRIDQLEQFNEGIDEIEKLAKLFDKGIISQEEFDLKKKQILGL